MASTFDIRFDRAVGLVSLFDAPANSFRWKGDGRLSIDAQGISVALKRGPFSLLVRQRSRRIPAQDITEVYREGEALRVEFTTAENPRAVLPFWTRDHDTAAQIMQLLPTSRTVELEGSTRPPVADHGKRGLMVAAVTMLAVVALFFGLRQKGEVEAPAIASASPGNPAVVAPPETPASAQAPADAAVPKPELPVPENERISEDEKRKLALMAEDPVDWTAPPPRANPAQPTESQTAPRKDRAATTASAAGTASAAAGPAATESPTETEAESFVPIEPPPIRVGVPLTVTPIRQGSLAWDAGRSLLRDFEAGSVQLNESYRQLRERFDTGQIGTAEFADSLESLQPKWNDLAVKLLNTRAAMDPALTGLRTTLLAVANYQGLFLTGYAAATRSGSVDAALYAFQDQKRADEALEQARQYFR